VYRSSPRQPAGEKMVRALLTEQCRNTALFGKCLCTLQLNMCDGGRTNQSNWVREQCVGGRRYLRKPNTFGVLLCTRVDSRQLPPSQKAPCGHTAPQIPQFLQHKIGHCQFHLKLHKDRCPRKQSGRGTQNGTGRREGRGNEHGNLREPAFF
jgi:hypothetical protein